MRSVRNLTAVFATVLLLLSAACMLSATGAEALSLLPQAHKLTMPVKRAEQRCLVAMAKGKGDRIHIHYALMQGFQAFEAWITRPDGQKMFQSLPDEHEKEQKVYFEAKTGGEHTFCVKNNGAEENLIAVSVTTLSKRKALKKLDPVVRSLAKTESLLIALNEEQEYLRVREADHRVTLETNNTRIAVRGVIEMLVMIGMSFGQVYFLRRLFGKKAERVA